jgi:hypothetical protein
MKWACGFLLVMFVTVAGVSCETFDDMCVRRPDVAECE